MKTLTAIAAALVVGFAATQSAQADQAQTDLPPTFIVYKLSQDGVKLRKLEAEHGHYQARIETTDGRIAKVKIDPHTGELTDIRDHAGASQGPAPTIDAAQAIQAVAATGAWDIREVELEKGVWKVKAADDSGRHTRFTVDATTAALR